VDSDPGVVDDSGGMHQSRVPTAIHLLLQVPHSFRTSTSPWLTQLILITILFDTIPVQILVPLI